VSQSLSTPAELTDKQRRILDHLRTKTDGVTYFKSRLIGEKLNLSPSEVGTNMHAIRSGSFDITVERWGKSGGTTWKVTEPSTTATGSITPDRE
jgi:hypothetical protein